MFKPVLFAAATLLLPALPLAAQSVNCATTMVQSELNLCAQQEWQIADARLNTTYQAAMALVKDWDARLPADERGGAVALRDAQRSWITFRDNACAAEGYAMKGGSAEPLLIYGCLRLLTEERTAHLQAMVTAYDY